MKNFNMAIFICGISIGAIGSWIFLKKKYEMIAQEEIESVKEVFSKRKTEDDKEYQPNNSERPEIYDTYVSKARDYSQYRPDINENTESNEEVHDDIVIISPEEFGEWSDYEEISLVYYADKVLAYENNEIVDDIEGTVGLDSLNHFGDYEDDSVFVRNHTLMCDYEILLDNRKYSDIFKKKEIDNEQITLELMED